MKNPCGGPAPVIGDGFNKSATIAIHLADDLASKRTKVSIAVANSVESKRAKSLRVDAVLENGCEQSVQSVQSEQSPLTDLCSFARRRIKASDQTG